jgi:hypothetical protein
MTVIHGPLVAATQAGPIALDRLAAGIDLLDAVVVFHLGDAHLFATWAREDGGVRPEEVVTALRDAYRVAQFASKRLFGGAAARVEAPAPLVTFELPERTVLLRRIRAHVVACVFDAAMPLGMARLIEGRLVAAIGPELPVHDPPPEAPRPRPVTPPGNLEPVVQARVDGLEPPPVNPLTFGSALPRRSRPPPPVSEGDRVRRLLAYLDGNAPEPHIARHRLALRAGLTLAALGRPEGLAPEAVVLIETAMQDILGMDRAELRRVV